MLPVTEPWGGSVSSIPFSLTNNDVLLPAEELCVGLLCLMSSNSVPFNTASALGEEASLAAASLLSSVKYNQSQNAYSNV